MRRRLIAAAVCGTVAMCGATAVGAQGYPAKPIRMVVGFAPGGGTDLVARIIGAKMNESWGSRARG